MMSTINKRCISCVSVSGVVALISVLILTESERGRDHKISSIALETKRQYAEDTNMMFHQNFLTMNTLLLFI